MHINDGIKIIENLIETCDHIAGTELLGVITAPDDENTRKLRSQYWMQARDGMKELREWMKLCGRELLGFSSGQLVAAAILNLKVLVWRNRTSPEFSEHVASCLRVALKSMRGDPH